MLDETQNTVQPESVNPNLGVQTGQTKGLVERAKAILLSPKTEWAVIAAETPDTGKIVTGYAIPLMLIPTIATFVGYALIGTAFLTASISWGLAYALITFIGGLIGIYLSAAIINALAGTFDSRGDFGRAMQMVVYASTPSWIAGVLNIFPVLSIPITLIAMIYGIYLFYLGLPLVMLTPKEKVVGYMIVAAIVMIVAYFVLAMIITPIMFAIFGLSLATSMVYP